MAERGVLFSGPMVCALIGGTKTQTRRGIVMPSRRGHSEFGRSDTAGYDWHFRDKELRWHDVRHDRLLELLQHRVDDRLWVKETSRITSWGEDGEVWMTYAADDAKSGVLYPNDEDYLERLCARVEKAGTKTDASGNYVDIPAGALVKPSIFMPRWASRLTLTVTDVRVQRLQDCNEEDARAEGITDTGNPLGRWMNYQPDSYPPGIGFNSAVNSYATLWNSINGEGAWQGNPWVAAYTFTVEHGNIDQVKP